MIFPTAGNNCKEGRKNNEKKNVVVQNRLGYCPIVLQKGRILCCNTVIVLQRFMLVGLGTVLQYTKVYCKLAGLVWAGCVLQYTKCIVTERS